MKETANINNYEIYRSSDGHIVMLPNLRGEGVASSAVDTTTSAYKKRDSMWKSAVSMAKNICNGTISVCGIKEVSVPESKLKHMLGKQKWRLHKIV